MGQELEDFLKKQISACEPLKEGVALYESNQGADYDLESAVNSWKAGIIPKSKWSQLKVIDCNQSYAQHAGRTKKELKDLPDIVPLMRLDASLLTEEQIKEIYKNINKNAAYEGFLQWKRPDNNPNWIKFSGIPYPSDRKLYILGFYTDITDKIIAQDKLQQFCASQAKAAHDFKGPVAGIIGWARQLRYHPDELHSCLMHIEKSANRLLSLAEASLNMNTALSGQMEIKPVWANLLDVEQIMDSIFSLAVAQKGLRWVCDFPIEKLSIFADELRLTQILQNLVQNAYKFTSKGEIKVHCKLLGGEAPSKGIEITVSDTGIGIDKENYQKIFEPYERLSRSTDGETGHGLGLTTTKELVQGMEGSISLTSHPGVGSTFTISLPKMEYRPAPSETEEEKAIKGPEKRNEG